MPTARPITMILAAAVLGFATPTSAADCPPEMALVALTEGAGICVDRWEASRPDATAESRGDVEGPAGSVPGVLPWTSVTLAAAAAACGEAKKRMCGFDELQQACAGDAGAQFPYGDLYDASACNGYASGLGKAAACGAFEGCASPDGVLDLSGNVQEWTDTVSPDQNPCVFGGDYHPGDLSDAQNEDSESCAPVGFFCIAYESAESSYNNVGFRCCSDVGAAPIVEDEPGDAGGTDAGHDDGAPQVEPDAGGPGDAGGSQDTAPDSAAPADADAGAHPDAGPPVLLDLVIGGGPGADAKAGELQPAREMPGGCGARADPAGLPAALVLLLACWRLRLLRRAREEPS